MVQGGVSGGARVVQEVCRDVAGVVQGWYRGSTGWSRVGEGEGQCCRGGAGTVQG